MKKNAEKSKGKDESSIENPNGTAIQEGRDRTRPIKFSIVSRGEDGTSVQVEIEIVTRYIAKIAEVAWPCSGHNRDVTGSKCSVLWKQWAAKINSPQILSVCAVVFVMENVKKCI